MNHFPNISGRHSLRLPSYDYSQNGAYFITLCTEAGERLFGEIRDGESVLNGYGNIVEEEWKMTGEKRQDVTMDYCCTMPNHFHGIILLLNDTNAASRIEVASSNTSIRKFGKMIPDSLPAIVRSFKSAVTKRINELRGTLGARVWQRNMWEHIIRTEAALMKCREYIENNPLKWELDEYYGLR